MLHECWQMFVMISRFMLAKRLDVWVRHRLMIEPCNWSRYRELKVVTNDLTNIHAYVN
jgi:hypothetical protein